MPKVRSGSGPHHPSASTSKKSAEKAAPKSKANEVKQTKKAEAKADTGFPRVAWKDTEKLGRAVAKAKDSLGMHDHPRLRHTRPDPVAGNPSRPPIVARYGVVFPPNNGGGGTVRPPIVARYGVVFPPNNGGGGGNVRPPIVARYGVVFPPNNGGGGNVRPPIVARYGVVFPPNHGGGGDVKPPIVARYGVIMPRPGIQTEPRPTLKHR